MYIIVLRLNSPLEGVTLSYVYHYQPLRDKILVLWLYWQQESAVSWRQYPIIFRCLPVNPWVPAPPPLYSTYLVGFGYCSSMSLLQGYIPLQAAIFCSLNAQKSLWVRLPSPGFELAYCRNLDNSIRLARPLGHPPRARTVECECPFNHCAHFYTNW